MRSYRMIFGTVLSIGGSLLPVILQAKEREPPASEQAVHQQIEGLDNVIVPITKFKILPGLKIGFNGRPQPKLNGDLLFGTGFCLDIACRFVVTNYHVARIDSPRKIKGQKVINRYLGTGPEDHDATIGFGRDPDVVAYAEKRDLALFELRWPIPKHHGLKYSLDDLIKGQEVSLCGYPLDGLNPFRHLVCVSARFEGPTVSGLLAFECDSSDHARGGMSGGVVLDKKTQKIVGVLNQADDSRAMAVPIQTLVDFVSKVQPFVAVKTFPAFKNVNPMSVDLYPEFEPAVDFNSKYEPKHSGVLEHRPVEPDDVVILREKAQRLADDMRNFIATQSYSWGTGNKEPEAYAEYEVRVVDREQRFRWYPDGKKELEEVATPRYRDYLAMGSDEWSELPMKVAKEYKLHIQRAADTEVGGKHIKVFQYRAHAEDKVCPFEPVDDYGFFKISKLVQVACYGEAWVDEDWNILRISENLDLSERLRDYRGWHQFRIVITYGQIKIGDEQSRLAPLTVFVEGENGKRVAWCRGTFSNYRLFGSHSRVLATTNDNRQDATRQ